MLIGTIATALRIVTGVARDGQEILQCHIQAQTSVLGDLRDRQGVAQLDVLEAQVTGILHIAAVGNDCQVVAGFLNRVRRVGGCPAVGDISQTVVVC